MRHLVGVLGITILLGSTGCGMFGGIDTEPKVEADCDGFLLNKRKKSVCLQYVEARKHYDAGEYDKARNKLRHSNFTKDKPWYIQFKKDIDEAKRKEKLPADVSPAQVKSIRILNEERTICPGKSFSLKMEVHTKDGKRYETWENARKKAGMVDYSLFEVSGAGIVPPKKQGVRRVQTDFDVLRAAQKGFVLKVNVVGHADINTSISLKPTLECKKETYFMGPAGRSGQNGRDGSNGSSGSNPTQGQNGGNGGQGGNAGVGPDIKVWAGIVKTRYFPRLVVVYAESSTGGKAWLATDKTDDGSIKVFTKGGRGGGGGRGGNGGDGGSASFNSNGPYRAGYGGASGGQGGNGGDGNNGGKAAYFYDKKHPELMKIVTVYTASGASGSYGGGGYGGGGGMDSTNRNRGSKGAQGPDGQSGRSGRPGPKPTSKGVSNKQLFPGAKVDVDFL